MKITKISTVALFLILAVSLSIAVFGDSERITIFVPAEEIIQLDGDSINTICPKHSWDIIGYGLWYPYSGCCDSTFHYVAQRTVIEECSNCHATRTSSFEYEVAYHTFSNGVCTVCGYQDTSY